MPTEKQIAANQANAQHSTGPKSEAGKAAIAHNNFRHGLAGGAFCVADHENRREYDALHLELAREYAPQTPTEEMLVEKMAQSYWLRRRALEFQTTWIERSVAGKPVPETQLALLMRYQTTHDRAFHAALNALLKLRAEKRQAEIGFESQKQREAAEVRRIAAETRKQELHKWALLLAEAKLTTEQQRNVNRQSAKTHPASKEEERAAARKAA